MDSLAHMRLRSFVFFALTLVAFCVPAADEEGKYVVWGAGRASCNTYLRERGDDTAMRKFKGFLMGYLTAYNVLTPGTYRISGQKDLDALLEWLDEYCEAHRLDSFERATQQLIRALEPDRLQRAPRPGDGWMR